MTGVTTGGAVIVAGADTTGGAGAGTATGAVGTALSAQSSEDIAKAPIALAVKYRSIFIMLSSLQ
jgi:hypothetical protein